jgi:hypothetical protein
MPKPSPMNEKSQSPLVKAVLALDESFTNLIRLADKIEENDLKTDNDIEQARKLMGRFAEFGEAISTGVAELSVRLNETRANAETAANKVALKADQIMGRQGEEAKKAEVFRALSEKVSALNQSLSNLRQPEGTTLTDADRARTISAFAEVENQLQPLIDEAQTLRDDAQKLKMKALEQQASSLAQHLINVKQTISTVTAQNRN